MKSNSAIKNLKDNVKISLEELKSDRKNFICFCKNNVFAIILMWFFILLAYGMKLFYNNVLLDTSAIINDYSALTHSWISFGRFGLVVTKKFFGLNPFCSYAACFLMICGIFIFSLTWSYLLNYFAGENNKKSICSCIFPILFLTSPLFAEQFNYILQSFEISFAIILCSLAVFFISKWIISSSNIVHLILGIGCMVWAFASYQAIICLYITAVLACYILIYISNKKEKSIVNINFFKWATAKYAGTFLIGYIIYALFDKLFRNMYGSSAYADNMVRWGKDSNIQCIKNILGYIKLSLLGDGVFYSKIFIFIVLIFVIYALLNLFSQNKNKILFLFAVGAFLLSPFLLSIYLGRDLIPRMQFCYQFVIAFGLYLFIWLIKDKKIEVIAVILVLLVALNQGYTVARLYSTEQMKYEQDVRIANDITVKIENLNLGEIPKYPVVLTGKHSNNIPNSLNGEVIGISWFEYGGSAQNALGLMKVLGYPYISPTQKQIDKGKEISKNMKLWPNTDSVKFVDDIIIVNFSEH